MRIFYRGLIYALTVTTLVAAFTGCETTGESAGLGALIGAGAGAIIGAGSGHAGRGAIIGAALGAASGAITHDVRETRAEKRRTAAETYKRYEYKPIDPATITTTTPSRSLSLVFENATIVPPSMRRGGMVEGSMQYAVLGAGAGREVIETRIVKMGEEIVSQVSSKSFMRNDGTWVSRQEFRIPESWKPGEYTLEQVVQSDDTWISGTVKFYVN